MVITLLSDFGSHDYSPGVAKGVLLKHFPQAALADLSHDIAPHYLLQAAYFLKSSYAFFPKHTFHLALIGLFHHRPFRPIVTAVNDHYFITADNGLLPLTFGNALKETYSTADTCLNLPDWIDKAAQIIRQIQESSTLSGLEVISPSDQPSPFEPYITEDGFSCQIIHIDRFGNVVLNLSQSLFEQERKGRSFQISFSRDDTIDRLSQHYSDVPEGEVLCLFNMGGYMELAVNKGSAARLFGFSIVRTHQLIYQKIKVSFQ